MRFSPRNTYRHDPLATDDQLLHKPGVPYAYDPEAARVQAEREGWGSFLRGFVQGGIVGGILVLSVLIVARLASGRPRLPVPTEWTPWAHHSYGHRYWDVCYGAPCPPLQLYGDSSVPVDPASEKFLLLETRGCGWNNERHSVEIAFTLAYMWRRTLVLPPVMGPNTWPQNLWAPNTTYDLSAMRQAIKVMTAEEFIAYARAHPQRFPGGASAVAKLGLETVARGAQIQWERFPGWFLGTEGVATNVLFHMNFTGRVALGGATEERAAEVAASPEYRSFATPLRKEAPLALSAEESGATALRFHPHALLGNFYTKVFVGDQAKRREVRHAVRRAVRLREEIFLAAAVAMKAGGISPGSYAAVHNRQGDWSGAHWSLYLDPLRPGLFTDQPENKEFLAEHGVIYIASNPNKTQAEAMDRVFYPAVRQLMAPPQKIVTLRGDVYDAAKRVAGHIEGWEGLVEMVICSQASSFLGSWGSTFTGYIHRLRGYMPDVTDKRILFFERSMIRQPNAGFPSWADATYASEIDLGREWKEGWSDDEP